MIKFLSLIGTCFLLINTTSQAQVGQYSITDLEVLVFNKNSQEFMAHARDIRPQNRNQHWREMVSEMGIHLVKDWAKRKKFEQGDFNKLQNYALWPSLRKDEQFQQEMAEYATQYFQSCFQSKSALGCAQEIDSYWIQSSKQVWLGEKLATLIQKYRPNHDLWSFFKEASLKADTTELCRKRVFKKTFLKYLKGHPETDPNSLAHENCWNEMERELREAMASTNRDIRNFAYTILEKRGKLDSTLKDYHQVLYILEEPQTGDRFNNAWNTVQKLGQNYQRRQKVYQKIKALDHLPDGIFASFDIKKKNVLIELFSKNFPEYLDHYAKSCLDYLEGKRDFPLGNPTMECRPFFRTVQGTDWVNASLQKRFQELPKL